MESSRPTLGAVMTEENEFLDSHSMQQRWARVRHGLEKELGAAAFQSWLRPVQFGSTNNDKLILLAPTRFLRDWVESRYGELIIALWREEDTKVNELVIEVRRQKVPQSPELQSSRKEIIKPTSERLSLHVVDSDDAAHGSPLSPKFRFSNFVIGKPNEFAHAAARRVAEADKVPFNPLYLYGGVGLGKTHLMHAIAWHIKERDPSRRVIYLSAEKFMYQFIRALRFKDTMAFKDQFRSVDVLMIDDVQFIGGKDSTQEEFFHTFNALVDQNRQVIISADKSPTDLEGLEERLRSRLGWGLVADIHPTTYELRLGILQSKVEKLGVAVPTKVLEFLAHKVTSNVRELEGAMNRIAAHATLVGRDITLEATQEVLHDLLRSYERRVTIEEIQRQVASHYQIRVGDMHSARRSRSIARPRQIAMFLAKQLTQHSLPDIGRRFGGRDHTTVLHAVKKIDELCLIDKQFQDDVEFLRRMLET